MTSLPVQQYWSGRVVLVLGGPGRDLLFCSVCKSSLLIQTILLPNFCCSLWPGASDVNGLVLLVRVFYFSNDWDWLKFGTGREMWQFGWIFAVAGSDVFSINALPESHAISHLDPSALQVVYLQVKFVGWLVGLFSFPICSCSGTSHLSTLNIILA